MIAEKCVRGNDVGTWLVGLREKQSGRSDTVLVKFSTTLSSPLIHLMGLGRKRVPVDSLPKGVRTMNAKTGCDVRRSN